MASAESAEVPKESAGKLAVERLERAGRIDLLQPEAELLRKLFDEIPVMITIYDPQVDQFQANRTFVELTGWNNQDLATVDVMEVIYPDPAYRATVRAFMESRQGWRDIEMTARDGSIIESSWANIRLSDERNVGIGLDIRARKEAEREQERLLQALAAEQASLRALNESLEEQVKERTRSLEHSNAALLEARDRFSTLFHSSPIATVLTELASGRIIDVNAAYLDFFALAREEALGRATLDLPIYAEPAERQRFVDLLLEQGYVSNLETRLQRRNGEERIALASVEQVTLAGQPALISSFIDITDRIRAEEQVRRLASELTLAEQRERRRISQVLHDDIQQMLIAHQMQLHLMAGKSDEPLQSQLRDAGNYVNEIIDATRTLSHQLGGAAMRTPYLRDGLLWLAFHMEEQYRLQVTLDMEGLHPVPREDLREMLLQAVRELLFNVVKHADTERAWVRVDEDAASRSDGALRIVVEDKGKGFAGPVAPDAAASAGGLGLYSIQERLELFGGTLSLQSSPGAGMTATIALPLEEIRAGDRE